MFFDPMYIVLVLLPGLAISGIASLMVKSAFNRYSKVRRSEV
jgi:Zn-dependent membrane protease YugP